MRVLLVPLLIICVTYTLHSQGFPVKQDLKKQGASYRLKWNGAVMAVFGGMQFFNNQGTSGGKRGILQFSAGKTHSAWFAAWAGMEHLKGKTAVENIPPAVKRDLLVEVINTPAGVSHTYRLYDCRVREYTALPDPDASAKTQSIQHMIIECEGWDRDTEADEPDED